MTQWVGRSIRRVEDRRLLTGGGRYIADLRLPGTLQVAFLRSVHAHARIGSIQVDGAAGMPGVAAVATAADLMAAGYDLEKLPQPPLAHGEVHYVGQPLAAVAADDRYRAEDACEALAVSYDPLPVVASVEEAIRPGAARARLGVENVAAVRSFACGSIEEAFARAEVVVEERLRIGRAAAHPLETRGILAATDPTGGLTVWVPAQAPHDLRRGLAEFFRLPEHGVRVVTPDAGGSFGVKNGLYPEYFVIAWLALRLGRPVQWIEDRREHFVATVQEREQIHELRLAATREGKLLGLHDRYWVDNGAYLFRKLTVPLRTARTIPGPYRIPNFLAECHVIYTNKTPIGPYRGAGRPQGCFVMERMMDRLAAALGMDRAEVRRRNLLRPEDFPYDTGLRDPEDGRAIAYDSANVPECLRRVLVRIGYEDFPEEQRRARAAGRYLGLGLACNMEDTGGGAFEGATVRLDRRGRVLIFTGSPSQGQGHDTMFAQLVADTLGIRPEEVEVGAVDTAAIPFGVGTYGSRSAVQAGNAVRQAARELREDVLRWAARLLSAEPEELDLDGGMVFVRRDPERRVSLAEIAAAAHSPRALPQPGLERTVYFSTENSTFASGAHAVVVEVDPETGRIRPLRYAILHDCGRVINPLLVEGQIHGGVSHGLSTVLLEELRYDEHGQLLTGSFLDYLLPLATDMPPLVIDHIETPSPLNPEGVKGAGESGVIPALPALAGAIEDALRPWGIVVRSLPVTPDQVVRWVQEAERGEGA